MRIRLIRKLALHLNGVDVSKFTVGDEIDLPERSAMLLVVEGWAEPITPPAPPAADSSRRSGRAE